LSGYIESWGPLKTISIYEKDNYRSIIKALLSEQKKHEEGLPLAVVAQSCHMQPSYLSNVLKERGHFSSDQAFMLMNFLKRSNEETEYLLLLIELERCGIPYRKKYLKEKINRLRQQHLRAEKYIESQGNQNEPEPHETARLQSKELEYYSDPLAPLFHIYLGTQKARSDLAGIARDLGVDTNRAKETLELLERHKLIQRSKGKWIPQAEPMHLSKDSPMLRMYHIAMRSLSIDRMIRMQSKDYYSFSATISMDESSQMAVRAEFLKFIQRAQEVVKSAPAERVLQLHFDLFPWTSEQ